MILNEPFSKSINKNKNIMIAYKWLSELHGVLCNDLKNKSEIKRHQSNLEKTLTMAKLAQQKYNYVDEHLEFLLYKKNCQVNFYMLFLRITI